MKRYEASAHYRTYWIRFGAIAPSTLYIRYVRVMFCLSRVPTKSELGDQTTVCLVFSADTYMRLQHLTRNHVTT
jgi:hypothetical protein